jgi:hypothetical protein
MRDELNESLEGTAEEPQMQQHSGEERIGKNKGWHGHHCF